MSARITVSQQAFGRLPGGAAATLTTLRNSADMQVAVSDYGAIITSILAPDRDGRLADVVLGFDSLEGYLGVHPYFGALVGRYANRIAYGSFMLDGALVQLEPNEGRHHLHGGAAGFDRFLWRALVEDDELILRRTSAAGEQGYPGNLAVEVRYRLDDANTLHMACTARTDAPTVVSLTQHSYFNLAGHGDILDHRLSIAASAYTPVSAELIAAGSVRPVAGTPFDFRSEHRIGERLDADDQQLAFGKGYDHNYMLDRDGSNGHAAPAARLADPVSGRVLELWTDQPGLQFYGGNMLDGSLQGKGRRFERHAGLCLEPQQFPNAPNVAAFPPAVLRPGEIYRHVSRYRFSTGP